MQEGKTTEEYVEIGDVLPEKMAETGSKLERFLRSIYFTGICVVLVAVSAFSLGRLSALRANRPPIEIKNQVISEVDKNVVGEVKGATDNSPQTPLLQPDKAYATPGKQEGGVVVGSKNGTKYHYPWCPGASQIAEKNKIFFNSIEEARAKGYTPAANCKGLK